MNSSVPIPQLNKYKITRRGRKLQVSEDARTLIALPKDVPERVWADILQKEENDLIVFDIREEILEEALKIGYERYMEKQNVLFTVHCAAMAWLKLIDWQFYRHDPGEEPSAYPPCHIPKRTESWSPDALPEPSARDAWCRQDLPELEPCSSDEGPVKFPSTDSIDIPVVEDIPREYWFPGKVKMGTDEEEVAQQKLRKTISSYGTETSRRASEDLAAESELLQHVTDYTADELNKKESAVSALKTTTPVESSLQGAGDSAVAVKLRKKYDKSKTFSRASVGRGSRSALQPLDKDSRSKLSVISDCRLRNLRLETQYEISSEKLNTPLGEPAKRK